MATNFTQPNKTQASIVETIALVIVVVLVLWYFVKPQSSALKDQRAQLQQVQTEYEGIEQEKNDLADLSAKMKAAPEDIALMDQALPLQNRYTQMELLLDSLVSASGMKSTDLSFQPLENDVVAGNKAIIDRPYSVERKLKATSFDLSVTGSIDQFKSLLQLIETNSRIIDINTMSMTNEQGNVTFRLKLKTYSYVP